MQCLYNKGYAKVTKNILLIRLFIKNAVFSIYIWVSNDKTNDPAAIESESKTKAAIEELEALGAIEIVSKRPKQHVITIL